MTQQTKTTQKKKKPLITKDMTIGDVVQHYPQTAIIFQEYGLHCVGCHVAFWETLEEGARGHGMDEETITMMIKDANTIAHKSVESKKEGTNNDTIITMTDAAINKVKEFMQREHKEQGYLRIGIVSGGCSGMSYDLSLEKEKTPTDTVISLGDINILINKEHKDILQGITIDYLDSLQGTGFKINNPNASNKCGCGNSFS